MFGIATNHDDKRELHYMHEQWNVIAFLKHTIDISQNFTVFIKRLPSRFGKVPFSISPGSLFRTYFITCALFILKFLFEN